MVVAKVPLDATCYALGNVDCLNGFDVTDALAMIRHGLGLHEIDSAVEKGAKRELSGFRKSRPESHRLLDDLPQHHRASVGAELDDVLAGVGMRSGEVGRHDLVAVRARERRVTRLQGSVELQQSARDVCGGRPADAHHADATAAGRRRNGDDGV